MTSQRDEPRVIGSVVEHYDRFLAAHYDWMFGVPFEAKVAEQRELLESAGVNGVPDGVAIDLGCGSGFQSLALSELGYRLLAIDSSERLIHDLAARAGSREIEMRVGDIRQSSSFALEDGADVIVCMGDTITHLSRREEVSGLFRSIECVLHRAGTLVVTYRDLATSELVGLDRFIPVHGDDDRIMTCFLEYEGADSVIVNDLVHVRGGDGKWSLRKSRYRKLRLPIDWMCGELTAAGLSVVLHRRVGGMILLAACKK